MNRTFAAFLFGLAFVAPALAQNPPGAVRPAPAARVAQKVDIQLRVVHATDSESGIDPRLQSLAGSFRYFKYKGYRLLSTQNATLAVSDDQTFSIEGGRRVKVTLLSVDEGRARVRLQISGSEGNILDSSVNINRDGTFIVAGPRYKDGILMLPVTASY